MHLFVLWVYCFLCCLIVCLLCVVTCFEYLLGVDCLGVVVDLVCLLVLLLFWCFYVCFDCFWFDWIFVGCLVFVGLILGFVFDWWICCRWCICCCFALVLLRFIWWLLLVCLGVFEFGWFLILLLFVLLFLIVFVCLGFACFGCSLTLTVCWFGGIDFVWLCWISAIY